MAIENDQRSRRQRAGNILGVAARPLQIQGMDGLGDVGFGTYSTFWKRECAVPEVGFNPLPLNHAVSDAWCDCVFGGTDTYAACVDTKYVFYPWTALGKVERGWNWNFTDFIPTGINLPSGGGGGSGGSGGGGGGGSGYTPAASAPTNTMLVGGGLLLAAYLLLK